jgi:hypothetical protein
MWDTGSGADSRQMEFVPANMQTIGRRKKTELGILEKYSKINHFTECLYFS